MKHHYKHPCNRLARTLALALQLSFYTLYTSHAAVPVAWTNSPGMPPYPIKPVPHGSTVDLAVTLRGYTTPPIADGADVRLWYQTNGMGSAWWSAPATFDGSTITASFGPAQDCGADRVSLFFGAPSNVFASAVLRLTHAPGFDPASLPLPVPVLDFATVELRNLSVLTNGWSFGSTPGNYEVVSNKAMNAAAAYKGEAELISCSWSNGSSKLLPSGTDGNAWRVSSGTRVQELAYNGMWLYRSYIVRLGSDAPDWQYTNTQSKAATVLAFDNVTLTRCDEEWGGTNYYPVVYSDDLPPTISNVVTKSYIEDLGITSEEEDPVWSADKPNYATKTELGSVSETANAAALDAASALRIVLGESVWFAVTNYMRTADGVIPSLQLWEVRDSVTNLVYDSREEITNTVKALTRELHTELTNRIHDVEKTIPSKAWGNYQSDGTDNPEPGKVAIVNQPTVILTGGGTFNKYLEVGNSSVWVLKSSGLCSFGGGGTNGNYFAVLDDEGNAHFKVSKTDSFDVDAICNGIFPRQSQNSVLLYFVSTNRLGQVYDSPPVLSASTNLQAAVWHEEVGGEVDPLGLSVSWARDDAISAWVGTITPDTYPPALFLKAKVKQEGGVSIINTAPVRFDGGVQFGNGTYRLVPYTTGGKTYLTVEGLP